MNKYTEKAVDEIFEKSQIKKLIVGFEYAALSL